MVLAICGRWSDMEILIIITVLSIIITTTILIINHIKLKQEYAKINKIIDDALNGNFIYDESLLSSTQQKLAEYISSCNLSAQNIKAEKDKIKELITDISHQTKTPISNILIYSQLLSEQELSDDSTKFVNEINTQTEKLSFLINSLIKTSRIETEMFIFSPKINRVEPMLVQIKNQLLNQAIKKNILLNLHNSNAVAKFDLKWTTEAIFNIVDNAIKYTHSGGKIEIHVTSYNMFCRIDIADNGIGISEEEHSKIFSRFYRSPKVSELNGIGIGLYLTRQIINNQGGYIKLSSKLNRGSTFSVFLPTE